MKLCSYIKLCAPDTLLLSEICHTLKIVSYHANVQLASEPGNVQPVARPSVAARKVKKSRKAKIRLMQTVSLPVNSSAVVQVRVKRSTGTDLMLELDKSWHDTLVVSDCLLRNDDGARSTAPIVVSNTSSSTQVLRKGAYLGKAATVNLIHADTEDSDSIVAEDELLTTYPQTYSNERLAMLAKTRIAKTAAVPSTITTHRRDEPSV